MEKTDQEKRIARARRNAYIALFAPAISLGQRCVMYMVPHPLIQVGSVYLAWFLLLLGAIFACLGIFHSLKINGKQGVKLFVISLIGLFLNGLFVLFGAYVIFSYIRAMSG